MRPRFCVLEAILLSNMSPWLSAQNQVQAVTPKGGPAKLAVQCAQPCSTVGQKAYVEVTLLDEQNNPVSASHKTKVEVEWSKSGSSTFSKHDTVEIHPGQDKVMVDWHPDDAGLWTLRVRDKDSKLLDNSNAVLITEPHSKPYFKGHKQ